jgi:G:T-mismatch repair DNA endonuclease (very short patch repair protein)
MIERTCPVCSVVYEVDPRLLKRGRRKACSRKCSYALRAAQMSKKVTGPCGVCGKTVSRSPSHVKAKSGALLCSRECHYKARSTGLVGREVTTPYNIPDSVREKLSKGQIARNKKRKDEGRYAQSEATKAKLRAATTAAIAEGRIKRVSQLEIAVGKVLDSLGIPYDHQHAIRDSAGRFIGVIDYYLTDHGAALEVNGTYWHADPRKYPNGPVHASQARTASRYQRKSEALHQRGIPLIEVWEQDFKADPEGAVKEALRLLV